MGGKLRFVTLAQTGRFTVSELCEQFGISCRSGQKYLSLYAQWGLFGLAERSLLMREQSNGEQS